jgi:hypothetical protein
MLTSDGGEGKEKVVAQQARGDGLPAGPSPGDRRVQQGVGALAVPAGGLSREGLPLFNRKDEPERGRQPRTLQAAALLTVEFFSHSGPAVCVGPIPEVHFVGPSLRAGPQGDEQAAYRNGLWVAQGRGFTTCEILPRCEVLFTTVGLIASPAYGPFEAVRVADGFLRYGDLFADLLAHLDEPSGLWLNYHDLRLYLAAVVRAVER